jgi:hypothetical protein
MSCLGAKFFQNPEQLHIELLDLCSLKDGFAETLHAGAELRRLT